MTSLDLVTLALIVIGALNRPLVGLAGTHQLTALARIAGAEDTRAVHT